MEESEEFVIYDGKRYRAVATIAPDLRVEAEWIEGFKEYRVFAEVQIFLKDQPEPIWKQQIFEGLVTKRKGLFRRKVVETPKDRLIQVGRKAFELAIKKDRDSSPNRNGGH